MSSITLNPSDHTNNNIYNKSFHRRNDSSDELDVFEASRYFSGYNESTTFSHPKMIMIREDHHNSRQQAWRSGGGRISLDVPMRDQSHLSSLSINNQLHYQKQSHHHHHGIMDQQKQMKEKKSYKQQPSSPGGRLASFLNSLFNQSSSKKKKSSKSTTQSMKDEEESPGGGGRRKRRSSISHFRSSSTTTDSKSLYSSSSSGFRTPPPYSHTPTKHNSSNYKQQMAVSLSKHNLGQVVKPTDAFNNVVAYSSSEKIKNSSKKTFTEKDRINFKFHDDDDDDGAESDSSSDLFELQNYDLGIYSSGGSLPVYETTHMDNIKRGAPISNGAFS